MKPESAAVFDARATVVRLDLMHGELSKFAGAAEMWEDEHWRDVWASLKSAQAAVAAAADLIEEVVP